MAYNSITTRLDELRFRSPTGTTSESTSGYTTPSRYSASFMPTHSQSSSEARSSLQRRFTTDLGKMQTLTPIGQQPAHAPESGEASSTVSDTILSLSTNECLSGVLIRNLFFVHFDKDKLIESFIKFRHKIQLVGFHFPSTYCDFHSALLS